MRTGGHHNRWAGIQSAQMYSGCQALVSLKCHFSHQELESTYKDLCQRPVCCQIETEKYDKD